MGFSPKRNKTNSGGKNQKVCIPKNYKMELLSKKKAIVILGGDHMGMISLILLLLLLLLVLWYKNLYPNR